MNTNEIEKELIRTGIESNEAKIEAKMLVRHFLSKSDVELILTDEFTPTDELIQAIKTRIETSKPIQYIIGEAYFMGEYFIVNENVLIPRDETEILVRKAIEIINKNSFNDVLDIGTGSGCIACIIAKSTQSQVVGLDISSAALQVAIDNAAKLNLFNKAIFRKSDIFSNVKEEDKFDLVVSNPPYIPPSEKEKVQKELKFEPQNALFTEDIDGLGFYEKISREAPKYLNKGGYLLFELGVGQSQKVAKFMKSNGFENIKIKKDLAGIDRIIYGYLR